MMDHDAETVTPKEEGGNRCGICQKDFSSKGNLRQHMNVHVAIDGEDSHSSTFVCGACGKIFSQKRYLIRHQTGCSTRKKQSKSTVYDCPLCGKVFSRISHLRRHESHHEQEREYGCASCDVKFVQQSHLDRHLRSTAHLQKEEQLQQAYGNPATDHPANKRQPKVADTSNQRRHKCPFCPKEFPERWQLQRHWRTVHPFAIQQKKKSATGERVRSATTFLLKCAYCGIRFDNDLLYQNHLEWHQGKRRHKCNVCQLAFQRNLELKNHQAAKHGLGWMFECVQCGQQFAQRTAIDRHLQRDCNQKNERRIDDSIVNDDDVTDIPGYFQNCKYCGAKSADVQSRRDHIAANHFRKIFAEQPSEPAVEQDVDTADGGSDQQSNILNLVVDISPDSKPVRQLRLGPVLPDWLLRFQPNFSTLDVALDDTDSPLMAGESMVLQLPLSNTMLREDAKTIHVVYSEEND